MNEDWGAYTKGNVCTTRENVAIRTPTLSDRRKAT